MADEPTPPVPTPTPTPAPDAASGWVARNWKYVTAALALIGWAIHFYNWTQTGGPIPAPPVVDVAQVQPAPPATPPVPVAVATGWVPDAGATETELQTARFRNFGDTPAGQVGMGELPKEVYLWKVVEKLTGKPTPLKDQNPTGSCVGFGTTTAVERTEATEITHRNGDPSEFTFFSEEVTYAGAKVQGMRSLGGTVSRQDGASDPGAAAWLVKVGGMVPKGKYGTYDLTQYDAARAHSWNISGVPAELVTVAKKYPVKDSTRVLNTDQCKQALASGYGVAICAAWKFSAERDANGVATEITCGELWQHCMACDGYIVLPDGREYFHIENSWTNLPDQNGNRTGQAYHKGPVGWGNPTTAGFWATSESIDRALRQGGSRAYSGVTGFPARKLNDWFIQAHPKVPLVAVRNDWALAP